jgi:hypothetical protein
MSRPSGRAPDVDPELIRQVMSRSPRPTSAAAAKWISEYLGRPVSASLIRLAIRRHPEWALGAGSSANDTTRRPVMKYECERALGPILPKDKKAHVWMMLTAYERMQAGILAHQAPSAVNADGFVAKRRKLGLVVDYTQSTGFYDRPAMPWELEVKSYLKMPPPEYARLEVEAALPDPEILGEVRKYWADWLSTDRILRGDLRVKGHG